MVSQDSIPEKETLTAVNTPLNIEPFFSCDGIMVTMNMNKPLAPTSRFGLFILSEYYGTYAAHRQAMENQFMSQTHLTYRLLKNLSLEGGLIINNVDGLRPTVGFQYSIGLPDFFFMIVPRVDLTQTHNVEVMSFLEYLPMFNEKWGLYIYIEGLYNQDMENNVHALSYFRLRVGLQYRSYRFGLGANFSAYGPSKFKDNQYGIFIGAIFF